VTSASEDRHGAGEAELRRRFSLRTEPFSLPGIELELILPISADSLIDESEFERDERLPYWAELWPSARALARHLAEAEIAAGTRIVELGCGVALPSLVLASRGLPVLATDYEPDALRFAEANALRNRIAGLRTALLDWREPDSLLETMELVLAADVLYEERNAAALADLLPRLVQQTGRALIADPGRAYFGVLRDSLEAAGWSVRQVDERIETSDPATGAVSRVSIFLITC
jgi:predicted nicotinamide N-methyase